MTGLWERPHARPRTGRRALRAPLMWGLALALAPVAAYAQAVPEPGAEPRPIYDASNWAAVTGTLSSLWAAWRADEAAQGRPRNEFGHLTNIQGGTIVAAQRPDTVPPEAVAFMALMAPDLLPGAIVVANAGSVAIAAAEEAARVAAVAAAGAAATDEGGGDPAGGEDDDGPGSTSEDRPGDDDGDEDEGGPPSEDEDSDDGSGEDSEGDDPEDDDAPPVDDDPGGPGDGDGSDDDEGVPDLGGGDDEDDGGDDDGGGPDAEFPPGSTQEVQGRPVNLYVPSGHAPGEGWGLVVALSGIAGNTDYPKAKLAGGCDATRMVYAGVKAVPQGTTHNWLADPQGNAEFLREVIRSAEGEFGLDPQRTLLFGFSNGAGYVIREGHLMDGEVEGFIAVESLGFTGTQDRMLNVVGSRQVEETRSDTRWRAWVPDMGHFIPGPRVPPFPDPGLDTTASGETVDAEAMFRWALREDG